MGLVHIPVSMRNRFPFKMSSLKMLLPAALSLHGNPVLAFFSGKCLRFCRLWGPHHHHHHLDPLSTSSWHAPAHFPGWEAESQRWWGHTGVEEQDSPGFPSSVLSNPKKCLSPCSAGLEEQAWG